MIVLASSSPRRREVLERIGLKFETISPEVDETRHPDEAPTSYVERLARTKAEVVGSADGGRVGRLGTADSDVVIAADTVVVHEGTVLGKPAHPAEARTMLLRIQDDVHHVITGVAVATQDKIVSDIDTTMVHMLPLTDDEVNNYIASGEPMDKAGAYGLQGRAGLFIDHIEGSPTNVIGLPVHLLRLLLQSVGVDLL